MTLERDPEPEQEALAPAVPPAGEEIHLPGPSLQPLLVAVGTTIALVGITTSWVAVVAGSIILVWTVARLDRGHARARWRSCRSTTPTTDERRAGAQRAPAGGAAPRRPSPPASSSGRCRASRAGRRRRRRRRRRGAGSRRAPSPPPPPPATRTAPRTPCRTSGGRRRTSASGSWPPPSDSSRSRSVMMPGPGASGSMTTAAPTRRSAIALAASRSVWPGPTVRTTSLIPSRTCMTGRDASSASLATEGSI